MSDYFKYNACRRHTCCPLSPEREFGISVKRAALDKIRHSSWRGEEQKRDGTGCRYSLRLLVRDKAQWPTPCIPRTMMTSRSFDHPVNARQYCVRDCDTKCFCRPQVNRQLDLRGLLDRKISRLRPGQYLIQVFSSAMIQWLVLEARSS